MTKEINSIQGTIWYPEFTNHEMTQMIELLDKDFKVSIVTMLSNIKKNVLLINEKIENVNS